MRDISHFVFVTLLVASTSPTLVSAQFVTPVPKLSNESVVLRQRFQEVFRRQHRGPLEDQLKRLTDADTAASATTPARASALAAVTAARRATCDELPIPSKTSCNEAITPDDIIAARTLAVPKRTAWPLHVGFPFTHSQGEIAAYLRQSSASDDARLFARFAANISDDEAYVVTDIISGLAGRALIAIDYAAVVAKANSDTASVRKTIEDNTTTTMRMVMNGGTLTSRIQAPIHAQLGPTWRSASSVYATVGLVGSIGQAQAMSAAGSLNYEFTSALTIRDVSESASFLGDLIVAGRVGVARSERTLIPGIQNSDISYAQLAVGLKQNGGLSLSTLSTWVFDPAFKKYMPRLIVNFSAVR